MSQLGLYSVIGDSNVKRHMTSTAIKGRPAMSSAKVILCGRLATFQSSLASVPMESDACVIACVTNFVTSSSPVGSVVQHVGPIFKSFFEKTFAFATERPGTQVFICSPMYRVSPLWYRDGLSEILIQFSLIMKELASRRTSNIWTMPSFERPQLESDGVHLNDFSGLQYVMHLFDESQEVYSASFLDNTSRVNLVAESSHALSDRVTVLEQGQARLSKGFEMQTAITAEFNEWQENVGNESFIMVQGLPRLPRLDQKEWQSKARDAVDQVLSDMGLSYKCSYVQNSTGRGEGSKTLYKAKMETVAISREIRDKFSGFFRGGQDKRPATLSAISIRNCVTPGTLARIAILQLLGRRYKTSNPGSRFQVVSYESRPILKLTPAPAASGSASAGSSGSRLLVFNFIEAVTKLPTSFTQAEIDDLLKRVSPRILPNLRSILVVLSEDMVKKTLSGKKKPIRKPKSGQTRSAPEDTAGSDSSEFLSPASNQVRKRQRNPESQGSGPSAKK